MRASERDYCTFTCYDTHSFSVANLLKRKKKVRRRGREGEKKKRR